MTKRSLCWLSLGAALPLLFGCAVKPAWQRIDLAASWRPFQFGGDGAHHSSADELTLEPGSPLTGGTFAVALPNDHYEIAFDARRITGIDFFCGLTFPVARGELTFVLGGWGGAVCGLSSLDGLDAAANATRTLRAFANGKDFDVRIRIEGESVRVWIDGEPFLSADLTGKDVAVRAEVEPCRPFGFCCYLTTARISRLRWRRA